MCFGAVLITPDLTGNQTSGILGKMAKLSKVTAKYQVIIPVNVRKELGILPRTEVDIAKEGPKYALVVDPIETIKRKWCKRFWGVLDWRLP